MVEPIALWRGGKGGVPRGVVAVAKGKPSSALHLAAQRGFWNLPFTYLKALASSKGWETKATLVEMVMYLVVQVLGDVSEDDMYAILCQRAFPEALWDNRWMANEDLLAELDSHALDCVQVWLP